MESEAASGSTFSVYLPCYAPIYQPVYHFHNSLPHIHLIAVVDQALRESYLQRIGHYLSMNISIYSELNEQTIAQLKHQLTDNKSDLTTILMLDYECYETYIAKSIDKSGDIVSDSTDNVDNTLRMVIDNCKLPKILLSRKPERGIPSTFLDEFDGFLNKPINVTVMVSELVRLAQYQFKVTGLDSAAISFDKDDNFQPASYDVKKSEGSENSIVDKQDTEIDLTAPLILIVEDNVVNQKIGRKLLEKLGYRSMIADNGKQALTLLEAHRRDISLILMDCRMPVMDGLEATLAIRSSGDNITIVALTANDSIEDRLLCQQVGMDEFLTKPVQKDKLQQVLKQYIDG